MEIFRLVKNHLAILGLSPIQTVQPYPMINYKLFGASLVMSLNLILCCAYYFFIASSFDEYIDSFCTASASVAIVGVFSVFVWKSKILYELMAKLQEIVNTSKYYYDMARASREINY